MHAFDEPQSDTQESDSFLKSLARRGRKNEGGDGHTDEHEVYPSAMPNSLGLWGHFFGQPDRELFRSLTEVKNSGGEWQARSSVRKQR